MTLIDYWGFDNWTDADIQNNFRNIDGSYIWSGQTDRFGNANGCFYGGDNYAPRCLQWPYIEINNPIIWGTAFKAVDVFDIQFRAYLRSIGYPNASVWFMNGTNAIHIYAHWPDGYENWEEGLLVYSQILPTSITSSWNYIEIEFYPDNTTGYLKVYLNSVLIYSDSTTDRWCNAWNNNSYNDEGWNGGMLIYGRCYIDDMYMIEVDSTEPNTPLGEIHIETLRPSANGTTNNGTASSGSNYECVDESAHNDDTDYVTLDAVNEIELYTIGNLSVTDGDIHAIKVTNSCKKDSAGSRSIQHVIRTNGTNYFSGTDIGLGDGYHLSNIAIWTLNPDDSAAWEIADINALESGIKITA